MFDTELFDTLECAPRSRRWTTAASFTLQAFAVGAMLVVPLVFTESLPRIQYAEYLTVPSAPRPTEQVVELVDQKAAERALGSEIRPDGRLIEPPRIPTSLNTFVDPLGSTFAPDATTVPYSTGPSGPSSVVERLIAAKPTPPPVHVEARREPLPVSTLSAGSLVHRVQPVYPPIAKTAHVQGPVIIAAVIDTDGRVESLKLISGHPLLVKAAMDAVRQWRYRPYVLNGQPIPVETHVKVVFALN